VFASLAQKVADAHKFSVNFETRITRANKILVELIMDGSRNEGGDGDNAGFGGEFDRNLRGRFM
jgi:hypothetical protein